MRAVLLVVVAVIVGCNEKPTATTESRAVQRDEPKSPPKPAGKKEEPKKDEVKKDAVKSGEPKAPPKKSQYEVSTAGNITLTQPADLWGLPDQNRAVLKDKFFGKRWNIEPAGNITVEPDHIIAKTHPHTEWLTVTVKFRNPKDLLTFDRYKSKLNGYCVDAFTFVDCVYVE